jgi:membrane associated rhomboid family serine protease
MDDYLARFKRFIYRNFDPVNKSVMVGSGLVYVLALLISGLRLLDLNGLLLLNPANVLVLPWTILTYPLVNPDLLTLIFAVFWLWFIGGSLERSWGSKRYGWFLLLIAGVTGLALAAIGFLFKVWVPVYGLWLPAVGITWAWANLNPNQELLLWGLVPVKAKWLAWLEVGLTFLTYFNSSKNIIFGLAAVSGVAVAYFYRGRNPFGGSSRSYRDAAAQQRARRRSRFRVIK